MRRRGGHARAPRRAVVRRLHDARARRADLLLLALALGHVGARDEHLLVAGRIHDRRRDPGHVDLRAVPPAPAGLALRGIAAPSAAVAHRHPVRRLARPARRARRSSRPAHLVLRPAESPLERRVHRVPDDDAVLVDDDEEALDRACDGTQELALALERELAEAVLGHVRPAHEIDGLPSHLPQRAARPFDGALFAAPCQPRALALDHRVPRDRPARSRRRRSPLRPAG